MKLHRLMLSAATAAFSVASLATAQSPDVLYTWDHSFGAAMGDSLEGWSGGGANVPALSNATDGVLTVTESAVGGDWSVGDSFNTAKEKAAAFTTGGIDLLGLDTIEFDVSHDGAGDINGQIYFQPNDGSGCCSYYSAPFTASPGANTISVDLNSLGMTPEEFKFVRSFGFQVFGHSEPAPLTWEFSEVRSGGTPLTERVIADYTTSPADLENVVVKFDTAGVSGGVGDAQDGLSLLDNSLRWVDVANEAGGAVAWGNGNVLTVGFNSRPLDISNYETATVVMKATGGAGADAELGVQLYAQYVDTVAANEYAYAGTDIVLPVDGEYHELVFPLAALGAESLDLTQWLGLNLQSHAGNMQIQVQSVVLNAVPEPTTVALLAVAGLFVAGRRKNG